MPVASLALCTGGSMQYLSPWCSVTVLIDGNLSYVFLTYHTDFLKKYLFLSKCLPFCFDIFSISMFLKCMFMDAVPGAVPLLVPPEVH